MQDLPGWAYGLLGTAATCVSIFLMYLYLFRCLLPKYIAAGVFQATGQMEKVIDRAQSMIREEREVTLKALDIWMDNALLDVDDRLNKVHGLMGKAQPLIEAMGGSRRRRSGGVIGDVIGAVMENPQMLSGLMQGMGAPSPGTPSPGAAAPKLYNLG